MASTSASTLVSASYNYRRPVTQPLGLCCYVPVQRKPGHRS